MVQLRVDDRVRRAGRKAGLVMIGHDHPHAQGLRKRYLVRVGNAKVHGNQQPVCLRKLRNGLRVQAVTVVPLRQVVRNGNAVRLQSLGQQRGGADAVGIIIAVHHNGPPFRLRRFQQRNRLAHAGQQKRIEQLRKLRM